MSQTLKAMNLKNSASKENFSWAYLRKVGKSQVLSKKPAFLLLSQAKIFWLEPRMVQAKLVPTQYLYLNK